MRERREKQALYGDKNLIDGIATPPVKKSDSRLLNQGRIALRRVRFGCWPVDFSSYSWCKQRGPARPQHYF